MFKKLINITPVLLLSLFLVACSNGSSDMAELEAYVSEQVNRSGGPIEPLPEFASYESFTYSATGLRGPFDVPIDIAASFRSADDEDVEPDLSRTKEFLESFPLASLRMVGSLSGGDMLWVLIQDDTSEIHRVSVGNYLGRNFGRIVTANDSKVELIEIVPSGNDGWIERPVSIALDR